METRSFNDIYFELLSSLYSNDQWELNKRTGVRICTMRGAYSFKLHMSDNMLPVAGNRRYWPKIAAAETAWQFMATKDPEWICSKAPKLWTKFIEDGELKTAYGYRWSHQFGRDQLDLAIKALRNDQSNRQIYISSWDPSCDGLGEPNQPKNIPCPVGFTLSVVNGELHMSVLIRSSDVFIGLPYDVMCYALTMRALCSSIGVRPGTMHFTLAHPHYYEPHREMVSRCVGSIPWAKYSPPMPVWSIEDILRSPDRYVALVNDLSLAVKQPDYSPLPELIL